MLSSRSARSSGRRRTASTPTCPIDTLLDALDARASSTRRPSLPAGRAGAVSADRADGTTTTTMPSRLHGGRCRSRRKRGRHPGPLQKPRHPYRQTARPTIGASSTRHGRPTMRPGPPLWRRWQSGPAMFMQRRACAGRSRRRDSSTRSDTGWIQPFVTASSR